MSDVTPKAQELADEKGVDLSQVEGSGKDGRILVEDVEKVVEERDSAMEAEDPAEDAEVVGEVAGEPLVVSQPSPETSVEAFKAHPHVPVDQQSPVELKDFQEESLATVEGTPEADEAEAKDDSDEEPVYGGASGPESDKDAEESGPGSNDWVRNRGLRERGFYVLSDEANPNVAKAAEEQAQAQADQQEEADRAAEQESQVDTSDGDQGEATHGESLREAAPSVAEVAGDSAPDESAKDEDDS